MNGAPPPWSLRFVGALYRWRLLVVLAGLAIGLLGAMGLNRVVFDPDVLVYFDRQMPERLALEAIEDRFGMTNEAVFVLRVRKGSMLDPQRLEAIRFLHEGARKLPGVLAVRSALSLAGGPQITPTPEAIAMLREAARAAGRAGLAVLSADETVAAVAAIVPRNSRDDIDIIAAARAARALQAEFRQRFPGIEALMTGRLMMDNAFLTEGQDETFFYAGVQFIVLGLVLLVTFRSILAALVLKAMVTVATLATVGVTGWLGFPLNGISSAAPSVLLGLAVATAVHIVMAWQAARRRGLDQEAAVAAALSMNLVPVTLSVLTTMASFLCLNFAASPPFRDLGNVVTGGLVLTYVAAFTLLPALLLILPPRLAYHGLPLEPAMGRLGALIIRRRRGLLAAFAAATAAALAGLGQITFDDTFSHYFDDRFEIRRATDLFEEKLSGTIFVDFSVPVASGEEAFETAHLQRVERFTAWLTARPEVADVLSLSRFAADLSARSLPQIARLGGPPGVGRTGAVLAAAYEAARQEGMIGLVDQAGRHSRVNVVLRGVSSADTLAFVRAAEAEAERIFGGAVMATGLPRLSAQLSLDSSRAMIISMLFTLAAVSLLLLISLRDVGLGLISLIPNFVPIIAAFGIWGFWVGEVSFAATVVGALTFGIIVDDTVHILVKYRVLRGEGQPPHAAIINTFRSVGIPVVATSVALALSFAVFTFSGFLVNQHLGWLTAIVITAALIADLFFLPPLLLLFDRGEKPKV